MADLILPGGIGGGLISRPSYGGGGGGGGGDLPPSLIEGWVADDGIILNGPDVTTWTGVKEGNQFTQSSGSKRPTRQAIGGRTYVVFDGINDILRCATYSQAQPHVLFVAMQNLTWDWDRFVMCGNDGYGAGCLKQSGGSNTIAVYTDTDGLGPSGTIGANAHHVLRFVYDGWSSACYVDGALTGTGYPGAATFNGLCLGADWLESAGSFSSVAIAGLIFCEPTIGSEEISMIEGMLS